MKINQLSQHYEAFRDKPIMVNTVLPGESKEGAGLISYKGFLVDEDENFLYIGLTGDLATTMVKWDSVVSIDVLNLEEEQELLDAKVVSGSKN